MKCFYIKEGLLNREDIDIRHLEFGGDEPEHIHDGIELVYICSGSGEHIVNGKVIKVKQGSFLIIDYESTHRIHIWENMKYYNILFKSSFVSADLDVADRLGTLLKKHYDYDVSKDFLYVELKDPDIRKKVENLLAEMIEERIHKKDHFIEVIRCCLDEVIALSLRAESINKESEEYQEDNNDLLFDAVLQYIENNCDKALMLEEVAKKFNYKPRYLSNMLKKYCGLSFKQFVIRKRLSNVIYSMCNGNEPIDEIISKCGFKNKTYFYNVFEKTYGIKPKSVRDYCDNYNKNCF